MPKIFKNSNGFTILEIIAVLVVMGILTAIAVTRAVNVDAELYTGADTLKMHLRYAQTLAINSNNKSGASTIWGISGNANSYWLFSGTDPSITANYGRLPEDASYVNADKTINLAKKKIRLGGNFTVFFDDRGIPYSPTNVPGGITALVSNLTVTVYPATGTATSILITITPLTGYVQ